MKETEYQEAAIRNREVDFIRVKMNLTKRIYPKERTSWQIFRIGTVHYAEGL